MLGHPIYSPWRGLQNVEFAKPFINALRSGRLVLQQCNDCGRTASPARMHCEHCRGQNLVWRRASGAGEVMAVTVYHKQYDHEYERKVPYNVVLVNTDEGAILIGSIEQGASQQDVGRRVLIDLKASSRGMPIWFTFLTSVTSEAAR